MRGGRFVLLTFLALLVLSIGSVRAQRAAPAATQSGRLPELEHVRFTLPNGLRVVLHEDHSTPVVAVNVWYHVGSMDEKPGRTGFAHLFEHMMFQGFEGYPYYLGGTLDELGAVRNGTTSPDRTNYFEVVPANFLETALFIEAGRMGRMLPAVTQERLDNQRDVVKNERRERIDNVPYARAYPRLLSLLYPAGHPYSWLVLGSMEDLTAASLDDVKAFFRAYYPPNNASLVLAGDFDPAKARALVEKHFGPIPAGNPVTRPQPAPVRLDREIREEVEDNVQMPLVQMVWHSPARFSKDEAAMDLLATILGGGKSSRLYRTLQVEQQKVVHIVTWNNALQLGGMFQVMATPVPGSSVDEIHRLVDEEIARVRTAGVTAEEVERAFTEFESRFFGELETVLGKADRLNEYTMLLDDPGYAAKDLARHRAVTAADVQRVAREYLTGGRVLLTVVPARTPPSGGPGAQTQAAPPAGSRPPAPRNANPPAGAQAARASGPSPRPKTMDLSLLPGGGPDPSLTLPPVQRHRLTNGLEVLVVEYRELPIVNLNLVFRSGAAAEPAAKGGLATLMADMLDEGTSSRSAAAIADALAGVGASLTLSADRDSTTASLRTLTRNFDTALDVYADVITSPAFPEPELRQRRDTLVNVLKMERDHADFVADVVLGRVLYGNHPYGRRLGGDMASLAAITREDVRAFYDTHVRPNNAALIVVGDVRAADVVAKLEKAFASWKPGPAPSPPDSTQPPARDRGAIYLVDRPGSVQSIVRVAQVGVPRNTPDFFPLEVMNRILGGATSSRLYMNLRHDKGYTYGVRSQFSYRREAGPFVARAAVQGFSTRESVVEFLRELDGIRVGIPFSDEEIDSARQAIIRGFPRRFETPQQIAAALEAVVIYGLPDDYLNTYTQKIAAVTREDLERVAKQHLHPDRMAIIVVGDRKAIEQPLREVEGYGENLTIVDAEGQPAAPPSASDPMQP
ncbi:MAG TPA: pitrilysin family protein [Vicinamibacterales bacterium]